MVKILEKVRKKKDKKPKKKVEFSEDALKKRDDYGLRARDYLYIIVGGLLTFVITYFILNLGGLNSIILSAIIMFVLYIILRKILEEKILKIREGYHITWVDPDGFLDIPIYHNLKLTYCKSRELPDGTLETIPETEYMLYYHERYMQRKINLLLDEDKDFLNSLEKRGYKVYFADGTDGRFPNPLQAMNYRIGIKESKGLTKKAKQKTTEWMSSKQTA